MREAGGRLRAVRRVPQAASGRCRWASRGCLRRFDTNDRALIDELAAVHGRAAEAVSLAPNPVAAVDAVLGLLDEAAPGLACWSVFVLDHDRLWAVAHRGYTMLPNGLTPERGVIGRAVRSAAPQLVSDVTADPDYVSGKRGMTSELVVPVLSAGEVVGVLNVESPTRLDEGALAALEPIVELLAGRLVELRDAPAVELSSLVRVFVHMSTLRDPHAIADLAARSLAHLLGLEASQVTLVDDGGSEVAAAWSRSTATALPEGFAAALREHVDRASIFDLVDAETAGLLELAGGCRSLVWLPLRVNDAEVGVLAGAARGTLAFPRVQAEAAALLAAQAAGSLDAALAIVRERRTAVTDSLTGLLNRRGFGDLLEVELERAAADRSPLSLCVLDCDEFKAVNDRGGHERGDRVLVELGDLIRDSLRDGETAARLGGDEFALMLPGTDAPAAHARADALRVALARGLAEAGTPLHVSGGVATFPFDGASGTQLLRAADQGLYAAKASGKDLVVAFRDLGHWTRGAATARPGDRRASTSPASGAALPAMEAELAAESAPDRLLVLLCRSLTGALSATAALVSRVEGDRLRDLAQYALRDIDLGGAAMYLVDDFPLTRRVLEGREPVGTSFLDDGIDSAEAFVLRRLGMSSLLMLPLVVRNRAWGLVEVYDVRLRAFEEADVEAARTFVAATAARLEELAAAGTDIDAFGSGAATPLQRPAS
jgi:diguanylate cyclase (GGDEF)-like protein